MTRGKDGPRISNSGTNTAKSKSRERIKLSSVENQSKGSTKANSNNL
jgi:hypothetical protein